MFTTASLDALYEGFIREYIMCIKNYQDQNDLQVNDIERAQKAFYMALVPIPIFVGLAVFLGFIV